MEDCPREIRFAHGSIRCIVQYHWEPAAPADTCSNPDCRDEGAFAALIVIRQIVLRDINAPGETVVTSADPLWSNITNAVRMRLGHGQTHCRTADSHFCEEAMSRQNYVATVRNFGVRINGTKEWNDLVDRLERKLNNERSIRKKLKKEKKEKRAHTRISHRH